MKKLLFILLISNLNTELFGQVKFFAGVNGSTYGSVLYNRNDWNADARLDYSPKAASSYGLEFGMQGKAGAGVTIGFEHSELAQRYTGINEESNPYTMLGVTKLNYLKIPVGIQLSSDPNSKASLLINGGFFFSQLTGYSDKFTVLFDENAQDSYSYILKNGQYTTFDMNGQETSQAKLSESPYAKSITGAHVAIGAAFRMFKRLQLAIQVKSEYTFGDLENKRDITNLESTKPVNFYENTYAKFTPEQGGIRSQTNLYNLGVQLKMRYYLNW